MNTSLQLQGHLSFTVQGFSATYTLNQETTTLTLCPKSFCQLLLDTKLIEDFASDRNGEPVILFEDKSTPVGYGYSFWCDFVRSFPMTLEMAVKLIEFRNERSAHQEFQAKVISLLQPLKAA